MLEYLLLVFYSVIFLLLMFRMPFYKNSGITFHWLVIFFLIKIISGETAWYIYTYIPYFQDSSDAFRYFSDGNTLYKSFFQDKHVFFSILTGNNLSDPSVKEYCSNLISWNRAYEISWFNESRTMIRFNALLDFMTLGNYHGNLFLSNMISFTSLLQIFRFFSDKAGSQNRIYWVLILFLLPSLVFWGSIPSKELFAIVSMGLILTGIQRVCRYKPGAVAYIVLLMGLLLLFISKYYLLFLLFPLILAFIINHKFFTSNPFNRYITYISWFFTLIMILNVVFPAFDPVYWLLQQQKNFFGLAHYRNQLPPLSALLESNSLLSLTFRSPLALLSGFIGIFFPPVMNIWSVLAILENFIIINVILFMITKLSGTPVKSNLFLFFLLLCLMDLVIIGFTTPYAGAIHRYRVITLPLLLCSLSSISAREPWQFLQKLQKNIITEAER
jgi:hypothetical protein